MQLAVAGGMRGFFSRLAILLKELWSTSMSLLYSIGELLVVAVVVAAVERTGSADFDAIGDTVLKEIVQKAPALLLAASDKLSFVLSGPLLALLDKAES